MPHASGRLVAREVLIRDEDGVRADQLRIPLGRLERWVNRAYVADLLRELMEGASAEPAQARPQQVGHRITVPARKGRAAYPESFYRRDADVVSAGHSAMVIAEASGVPPTTVNRWIKGARERGFLARSRKAGEN